MNCKKCGAETIVSSFKCPKCGLPAEESKFCKGGSFPATIWRNTYKKDERGIDITIPEDYTHHNCLDVMRVPEELIVSEKDDGHLHLECKCGHQWNDEPLDVKTAKDSKKRGKV